jgi:anti-anti-sigma factor
VDIASRMYADVVVVEPAGRIDIAAGPEFERAVLSLADPSVGARAGLVFDLERVEYIGSLGLRVFIIVAKELRSRGARIAVAQLRPVVAEILAVARFENVVEIYPTVTAALAAVSGDALGQYRTASGARTS